MATEKHQAEGDGGAVHTHITPIKVYLGVFGALIFFTVLTFALYKVRLGEWNLLVAIVIASAKATLVLLYFMHMKHETKFNVLAFLSAIIFGAIFLGYTLNDTETRGEYDRYGGTRYDDARGEYAAGNPAALAAALEEEAEVGVENQVDAEAGVGTPAVGEVVPARGEDEQGVELDSEELEPQESPGVAGEGAGAGPEQ